jgi:CRP-like cAMP-binding protein
MPRLPVFHRRPDGPGSILGGAPFLSVLESELRERVLARMSRRRIEPGKTLYRQSGPADALYLVESGRFRTFVSDRPGQERVPQFLDPGEIAGESAFMAEREQAALSGRSA